jgi:hypothetical protein
MKEYAKQNKDSDMSLASTKKKEDFGGMLPAFQFSCASCKTLCSLSALLRCHAVAWAMRGLKTNCVAFRCLLLFPSSHIRISTQLFSHSGPILAAAIPQNRDLALKEGKKDEAIENLLGVRPFIVCSVRLEA